jgi:hypothetical protein
VRTLRPILAFLVIAAAALASTANATITATSGQAVKIAPPPSVQLGALESDTTIHTFDEQQCVTLANDLNVDITASGVYDATADLTPGVIAAGTKVSSHFIHIDSATGKRGNPITFDGGITVDSNVLGIALTGATLTASDVLGAPGTAYPVKLRRFSLDNGDVVTLSDDLRSVTVHAVNRSHADQARVITVCEDGEEGEGCTPGFWKQEQHFDSWVGYTQDQLFNDVFGVGTFPDLTLLEALDLGGGGAEALARHGVAALLNAASPDVDYPLSEAEVIALVHDALVSGDEGVIEDAKNQLEGFNEAGCPLSSGVSS